MHEKRVSCLVVADESEVLGVITERDIVRLFDQSLQNGKIPELAKDVMSSPPLTVTIGTNVSDAMAIAWARSVRHLPVVDSDQQLVGIATQTDLLKGYQKELERRTDQLAERTRVLSSFQNEVDELSLGDRVLDVANRRAMEVVLTHTHLASRRHKRNYAIVVVGLDHAKEYRTSHGQTGAESLLRGMAGCLAMRVRRTDQIFRFGDDTFLALLPEATLRAAVLLAYRSQSSLARLFSLEGEGAGPRVALRIGYASFDGAAAETPQDWKNVVMRAEYSLLRPGDGMMPPSVC